MFCECPLYSPCLCLRDVLDVAAAEGGGADRGVVAHAHAVRQAVRAQGLGNLKQSFVMLLFKIICGRLRVFLVSNRATYSDKTLGYFIISVDINRGLRYRVLSLPLMTVPRTPCSPRGSRFWGHQYGWYQNLELWARWKILNNYWEARLLDTWKRHAMLEYI